MKTTKWCSAGQHEVSITNFWKKGKYLQTNCIQCQSTLCKIRYRQDSKRHVTNVRRNTIRRNTIFKEWKSTLGCSLCSENHTSCLEFHHVNPTHKDFTVGEAFNKRGIELVLQEIQKCVVLCANCHRKVHDNVLTITDDMKCVPSLLIEMLE